MSVEDTFARGLVPPNFFTANKASWKADQTRLAARKSKENQMIRPLIRDLMGVRLLTRIGCEPIWVYSHSAPVELSEESEPR